MVIRDATCPHLRGPQARQHLINSDEVNRASLEAVETSLFCLALERDSPESLEDRSTAALLGSGRNRWVSSSGA